MFILLENILASDEKHLENNRRSGKEHLHFVALKAIVVYDAYTNFFRCLHGLQNYVRQRCLFSKMLTDFYLCSETLLNWVGS